MTFSFRCQDRVVHGFLIVRHVAWLLLMSSLLACASAPQNGSEAPQQSTQNKPSLELEAKSAQVKKPGQQEKDTSDIGPYEKIPPGPSVVVGADPASEEGEAVVSSVIAYDEFKDPLMWFNRPVFKFNNVTYRYVLTPLSRGYQAVVPAPVDKGIGNFFHNLREPLYSLNNLLQGKFAKSGKSLARFAINSTVGLLGFFDPANAWWEIERKDTSFGDTLARYGVGYGSYLVLPILGPSDLRDTASLGFDYFLHPLNNINDKDAGRALLVVDGFQSLVPTLVDYPQVMDAAEDPYIFVRNLYLQGVQRDAQALRGEFDKPQPPSGKTSAAEERKTSDESADEEP